MPISIQDESELDVDNVDRLIARAQMTMDRDETTIDKGSIEIANYDQTRLDPEIESIVNEL